MTLPAPHPLSRLETAEGAVELGQLLTLHRTGVPLAPLHVVPAAAEERFYTLNNLPARLAAAFRGLDPADPDEDDVEDAAQEAQDLVRTHYLLDEFIDLFYRETEALPERLRLRRAGDSGAVAVRGRPALMALKLLWSADWTLEAVMARAARTGAFTLEAQPVIIGPADDAPAPTALTRRVSALLGADVPVFADASGGVSRLVGAR